VADGWCWFVVREKYCWLVADKPSEQAAITTDVSNSNGTCNEVLIGKHDDHHCKIINQSYQILHQNLKISANYPPNADSWSWITCSLQL
jgi:hypothetical protein